MIIDIKAATMAQLIAAFNHLNPDKPVKRFADRKTAERRVAAAMNGGAATKAVKDTSGKPIVTAPVAKKTTKKVNATKQSSSIKDSWNDKKVAAARAKKDKVRVGGQTYRSVLAAFEALRLPVSKHIKFRAELKASGRKDFSGHTFTIVKGEEA